MAELEARRVAAEYNEADALIIIVRDPSDPNDLGHCIGPFAKDAEADAIAYADRLRDNWRRFEGDNDPLRFDVRPMYGPKGQT